MAKRKTTESVTRTGKSSMHLSTNFDSYQVIKSFINAGIKEPQAEVIVTAIMQGKDHDFSKLATREQLATINQDIALLKQQATNLEKNIDIKLESVKSELKQEAEANKNELKLEAEANKNELRLEIETTKNELRLEAEANKNELKLEIETNKNELKLEIELLRQEVKQDILKLEAKINKQESNIIKWMVATMFTFSGIIFAMLKYVL